MTGAAGSPKLSDHALSLARRRPRRSLRRPAILARWTLLGTACLVALPATAAQAAPPASPTTAGRAVLSAAAARTAPPGNALLTSGRLAATACPEPPLVDGASRGRGST
nr:hypothetical protein GCM10020093_039360 [Planobispora longispora]